MEPQELNKNDWIAVHDAYIGYNSVKNWLADIEKRLWLLFAQWLQFLFLI